MYKLRMKKNPMVRYSLLAVAALWFSPNVSLAELSDSATLSVTEAEGGFTRPPNGTGSWFAMESLGPGAWVYTGVEGKDGVTIGTAQAAETAGGTAEVIKSSIDNPWIFFANFGLHQTTSAPTILNDDGSGKVSLDFSGWSIAWNGIANIPMSGGAQPGADGDLANADGEALMVCGATCENGDSYILDYTATVPQGSGTSFDGVKYHIHLEGEIASTASGGGTTEPPVIAPADPDQPREISEDAPVASIAHGALATGGRTTIDLSGKVTDPQGNDTVDFSSLGFSDNCTGGGVVFASDEGVVTYADGAAIEESCEVTYTVKDNTGLESAEGTITIRVREGNIAPIANDDTVVASAGQTIEIDVLGNDVDGDDAIDGSTVETEGGSGSVSVNSTGVVTYTPAAGATGSDSFTYTFTDPKSEISNIATVTVRINEAPVAIADTLTVGRNTSASVAVLDNDTDDGGLDPTTVTATDGANGTTEVDAATGTVTYTPVTGFSGSDSFDYTVNDIDGSVSNSATVAVDVVNAVPEAADVSATLNSATSSSTVIDPLAGVSDADGELDATSVAIVTQPENGTATVDASTGAITYTPNAGFLGADSFTFTVNDNDGGTSNEGTINVTVADASAAILDPASILSINPGASATVKPEVGAGSWFAMEAAGPGGWIYVGLAGNQGLALTTTQSATSAPIVPGIDNPWTFFGNTGVSLSTSDVSIISDDGAGNVLLDFSGWGVSWNSIPVIPLVKRPHGGVDGGATRNAESVAIMTCEGDCSDGDTYTIFYTATVPDGDPSGFGNVSYELHLEGKVSLDVPSLGGGDANAPAIVETITVSGGFSLASAATNSATEDSANVSGISAQTRLSTRELSLLPGDTAVSLGIETGIGINSTSLGLSDPVINPDSGAQCIGGCTDFVVTGVDAGEQIQIVYRMDEDIPEGAIFRLFATSKWSSFDAATGDEIGSAAAAENGLCTDASGVFQIGLQPGNRCIFLNIRDGGANDADGVENGEVRSLGGVAFAGAANRPKGSSSGCSVSGDPVHLYERADWFLVFGLMLWLGVMLRIRRNN